MWLRQHHHAHVFEGVSRAGPAVTAVHLGQSRGSVKRQKMVLIIVEKDKRTRREIMERQGWKRAGKER